MIFLNESASLSHFQNTVTHNRKYIQFYVKIKVVEKRKAQVEVSILLEQLIPRNGRINLVKAI